MPNVAEYEKRRKKIEWKRGGRSSERGAQKRKRPGSPSSSFLGSREEALEKEGFMNLVRTPGGDTAGHGGGWKNIHHQG